MKKPKPKRTCFLAPVVAQAFCNLNQYNFGHNLCSAVIKISESRLFNNQFTADFHTNGTFSNIFAMITHNIVGHEVSNFLVTYNVDVKLKIFAKSTHVKKVAEFPTYLNNIALKRGVSILQKSTDNIEFPHCIHINSQLALEINELKIISYVTKQPLDCYSNLTHWMIVQAHLWGQIQVF